MSNVFKVFLFAVVSAILSACATRSAEPPPHETNYREDIRKVVREHVNDFGTCYNAHLDDLKKTGTTDGKIVLHWFTDTLGKVIVADIKSDTIKNDSFNDCLLEALKKIQFPQAPLLNGEAVDKTVTEITYPFTFQKQTPEKQKAQETPEPSIETK